MPFVTSESVCDCCCPPDGKKCFQEWIASWSCATSTWSGPVTDNRLCLPTTTDLNWAKISGDASGCEYRIYVPYDPKHCCSVNGDCDSSLGDTATPTLPFGGGTPTDCPCSDTSTPCTNCPGDTPLTYNVSFDSVGNDPSHCGDFCSYGSYQGGSGELGDYTLSQVTACTWEFVGTGPSITHFYEQLDCTGPSNTYDGLKVRLSAQAGGFKLEAFLTGGAMGTLLWFVCTIVSSAGCCAVLDFTNELTYDCDNVGEGGTAVATPSC